ncbi:MAG: hypothetical protein JW744_03655 [Candidatus Diapherotrites archaeon]|uniref:Uncharacterized protein n=1 Tax=Candidatus Iainarchaeum sp. TaxID=3101447 RepID=A0A938YWQ7_9ARCH|nr:hypothetical protein [Candidatus Diapherotrites archaeon]
MHPFYNEKLIKKFPKYLEVVENLLKKSKWPIVVLQGFENIPQTKERLRKLKARNVLIIPTANHSSATIRKKTTWKEILDHKQEQLIKCLAQKAGVKSVYVGGMYASTSGSAKSVEEYEAGWLAEKLQGRKSRFEYVERPFTGGCAGATYEYLIESGKFKKVRWVPNARLDGWKTDLSRPYVAPRTQPRVKIHRK